MVAAAAKPFVVHHQRYDLVLAECGVLGQFLIPVQPVAGKHRALSVAVALALVVPVVEPASRHRAPDS